MKAADVKEHAKGRWSEVFRRVGMSDDAMNGRHQPCPKCGGEDRFRVHDDFEDTGGMLCNQCGPKLGDGIKAYQWFVGCDFKTALAEIADSVGFKPQKKERPAEDSLEFQGFSESLAAMYAAAKPGVTVEAMKYCGTRMAQYHGRTTVFALPIIGESMNPEKPAGFVLMEYQGRPMPSKSGKLVKIKTTTNSKPGLVGQAAFERLMTPGLVKRCWKVEGITDLFALTGLIPDSNRTTEVVITNAHGAMQDPKWMAGVLAASGAEVICLGDADFPGKAGALRWAESVRNVGGRAKVASLPYEIEESHGKDVRDWIVAGATYGDLCVMAERATSLEPVSDAAPADPILGYRRILELLKLEVQYELDNGHVRVFSYDLHKSSWIPRPDRLGWCDLLQCAGPIVLQHVTEPGHEVEHNQVSLYEVRSAIAAVSSLRRGRADEVGCGLWAGRNESGQATETIVLVNGVSAARYNGDRVLRPVSTPRVDGLVIDYNSPIDDWFDFEEMAQLVEEAKNVEFRMAAVERIATCLKQWIWRYPETDPFLVTGLIAATFLQTIWTWRPHVAVVGQSGSGKSTLFDYICGGLAGPGLFGKLSLKAVETSPAGIRQSMRNKALALFCDEFESSDSRQAILSMLRSSSRGDTVRKGSPGQEAVAFRLQHIAWVSATESGLRYQPDLNRFIQVTILTPPAGRGAGIALPECVDRVRDGMKLFASCIWAAPGIRKIGDVLRKAAIPGAEFRTIENMVPAVSILSVLLGEPDNAISLLRKIIFDRAEEVAENSEKDHERLLIDILGSPISKSGHLSTYTVGGVLDSATNRADPEIARALNACGIRVLTDGRIFIHCDRVQRSLLSGTEWARQRIVQHLKRIEGAESTAARLDGVILRGVSIKIPSETPKIDEI